MATPHCYQSKMDYNLDPKLETMSVVRIAFEMWRQSEARSLFIKVEPDTNFKQSSWNSKVMNIGEQLLEKVSQLPVPNILQARMFAEICLPEILQAKIKTLIKPMGKEILDYLSEVSAALKPHFGPYLIDHLCWTPFGIIDQTRTAQTFLEKGFFNERDRYPIACQYICKDYISVLRNESLQNVQNKDGSSNHSDEDCCEKCVVPFWSLRRESNFYSLFAPRPQEYYDVRIENLPLPPVTLENLINYARCSISGHNFPAFTYFWNKFKDEEKENNVIELASRSLNNSVFDVGKHSMITIFLLSQMNRQQQMSFIERNSFLILKCLGNFWLLHDSFLPTVKFVTVNSIGRYDYQKLLEMIAQKFNENEWEGEKYNKWFEELWMQSPNYLKKYIIENPDELFKFLGDGNNFKSIKLIIDEANAEERKNLKDSAMKKLCKHLLLTDKLEFLDKLLKYSFSREDIGDISRQFLLDAGTFCDLISNDKWLSLDKLLNFFGDLSVERIFELKRQLFLGGGRKVCNKLLLHDSHLTTVWIDKFLNWSSSTTEAVTELKKVLITNGEDEIDKSICFKLFELARMDYADDLVRACFSAEEEILEFKKGLMMSDEGISFYLEIMTMRTIHFDYDDPPEFNDWHMATITRWFNVQKEDLVEFMQKYEESVNLKFSDDDDYDDDDRENLTNELQSIFKFYLEIEPNWKHWFP